ncbi:MAG: DUF5930 domain-containing protein [Rhodopseudomonas palustris]|nr:DUF5930 domain-containing protein [Rhodopseudomonas palustris]
MTLALAEQTGSTRTRSAACRDTADDAEQLYRRAGRHRAATRRDMANAVVMAQDEDRGGRAGQGRTGSERNDAIFARLEEAVTVSMEPLDKMFRAAGLADDDRCRRRCAAAIPARAWPLSPISHFDQGRATMTAGRTARERDPRTDSTG